MKFAIYSRKSKFISSSDSIKNQVLICKDFIKLKFPDVSESDLFIFEDEDCIGANTNRPSFQKLLRYIERKDIDFVVCYKLDRISRSVNDFSSFIDKLEKKDIKFISVTEHFDTSSPIGKAMLNITAVFAQLERDTLAERIRDNMQMLAKTGRWLGGTVPRGFISEKSQNIVLDGKLRTSSFLKIDDTSIESVIWIFQNFLKTGNLNSTAKSAFDLGFTSNKSTMLSITTIKFILTNPVYCTADKLSFEYFSSKGANVCFDKKDFPKSLGIIPYRVKSHYNVSDWIIALGKHKGVIKSVDWINVQNILAKNHSFPSVNRSEGLLTGLIRCPLCNSSMQIRFYPRKKGDYFVYVCNNKCNNGVKSCNSKNLNGKLIEEQVINTIFNFDQKELRKRLHSRKYAQRVNKLIDNAEELHFKIISLKEKQDKYLRHLLNENPNSTFAIKVKEKVTSIEKQIKKCKVLKHKFEIDSRNALDDKASSDQIFKNISFFKQNFYSLNIQEKKSLLRLIVNKVLWVNNSLTVLINGEY